MEVELDVAVYIGSLNQAFHHPMGDGLRLSAIGKQAVDAKCPIDAASAIAPPIQDREDIAGKQRDGDRLNVAGVAAVLPISRDEAAKSLVVKLLRGP